MQNAGPVRRLADGTIDYGFYRAEASHLRQRSRQRFWCEIGRRWAARLNALNPQSGNLAAGSPVCRASQSSSGLSQAS